MSIIRTWNPVGVKEREGTQAEMALLFDKLPEDLTQHIQSLYQPEQLMQLNEIYIQLGQYPECIFTNPINGTISRQRILDDRCNHNHIEIFADFFKDKITKDGTLTAKRKGISGTLHRVSVITDPSVEPDGVEVLGVTVRVGRAMEGLIETMVSGLNFFKPLVTQRQSLLIIGRPGVGKSTALREIANLLSQDPTLTVVVVDKTKELGGDGKTPHQAIGNSRWMPVGKKNHQHNIMIEAVENQSPNIIIVDEISNMEEVRACQTIAQRGIMLIATVHGNTLPELVNDRERSALVGGCNTVTLSGREAERRIDKRKQILKRSREPVFHAALELHSRSKWIYHENIKNSVDAYLENEHCHALRLQPGKAIKTTCVPGEGVFNYCDNPPPPSSEDNNFSSFCSFDTQSSFVSTSGGGSSNPSSLVIAKNNKSKRQQYSRFQGGKKTEY